MTILLAQGETAAKAVETMATTQDVRVFLAAAFVLAVGTTVYFFYKWQGAEDKLDAAHAQQAARAEALLDKALARGKGESKE